VSNDWNDIGNIFKSSLDQNPGGEPIDPWTGIEKRVVRSNFFSFNAASFNVYYLTFAMVLMSAMGYSAYKAADFHFELKKKNEIIRQYQRKELEEKIKVYLADSIKNNLEKTDSTFVKNIESLEVIASRNMEIKNNKSKPHDEFHKSSQSGNLPDTINRLTVKKKVVRKQVIIKHPQQIRDSIVVK
jgi:hypothetical protein